LLRVDGKYIYQNTDATEIVPRGGPFSGLTGKILEKALLDEELGIAAVKEII
jgi:hypothetical protein